LNLMDYYMWSVIQVINKSKHPNVTSQRDAIETALTNIDNDIVESMPVLQDEDRSNHRSKRRDVE